MIVRYELGRQNWAPASEQGRPWVPAFLRGQTGNVRLADDQVIDVVILGDGYQEEAQFRRQLDEWLVEFFAVEVYERFRGAFRIRALYTESEAPCTIERRSYYGVKVRSNGKVARNDWWNAGSFLNMKFRHRLFESVERFGVNKTRYPRNLGVGGSSTVIHNELKGLYSHLIVLMLVRSCSEYCTIIPNATGMTRRVRRRKGTYLNVGFGSHSLHELGHAFAYLEDEYISKRRTLANRHNPSKPSIFTLSNLSFGNRVKDSPWLHVSPWGLMFRQAAGSEPSPIVGWLWRGGEQDFLVWHSEYQCLMNGYHENYAFTGDARADPTATPSSCIRLEDEPPGAYLRWRNPVRYCMWCQEIVAVRILEKTGQFARTGDPRNINARGRAWYARWQVEGRARYWTFFNVPQQIAAREALYAAPGTEPQSFCQIRNADGSYLDLSLSDLYEPFSADSQEATKVIPLSDDEEFLAVFA